MRTNLPGTTGLAPATDDLSPAPSPVTDDLTNRSRRSRVRRAEVALVAHYLRALRVGTARGGVQGDGRGFGALA